MTELWNTAVDTYARIPNQVWVGILGVLLIGSVVALPLARRRAYLAGQHVAGRRSATDRRDRALTLGALIPAFGFLAAVLVGSQRGLVTFGRDDLHWHDGWEFLVPATLDGVGLAFGFLAFRAVRKRRSPDRAVRVAWGAATASAVINFFHESNLPAGSALGGAYLALLSMFVMVMFHELLDQFVEGTEYIRRENPAFKLRWLTWPSNTACAWVAWRNWPPAEGTAATVGAAVEHLERVRATKRDLRRLRDLETVESGIPGWTRVTPWVRARMLDVKLTAERTVHLTEQTETAARLAAVEAEQVAERARYAEAVQAAEQARVEMAQLAERLTEAAEQAATERAERAAVQARADEAERRLAETGNLLEDMSERLTAARIEAEQRVAQVRTEALELIANRTEQQERAEQGGGAPPKSGRSAAAPNAPKLTDAEALRALLRAHPERDFEWTKREVHRITGAGFGRVDRLIAAVAEHHRSTAEQFAAERRTGTDDPNGADHQARTAKTNGHAVPDLINN